MCRPHRKHSWAPRNRPNNGGHRAQEVRNIACATRLGRKQPAWLYNGRDIGNSWGVIVKPVQRRDVQDGVYGFDRQRMAEICPDDIDPVETAGEPRPELLQHGLGAVHRDHSAEWQYVQQLLDIPAGAAAEVQHGLVADDVQSLNGVNAPPFVRQGRHVVHLGVPLQQGHAAKLSETYAVFAQGSRGMVRYFSVNSRDPRSPGRSMPGQPAHTRRIP